MAPTSIEIRPAEREDLPRAQEIHRHYVVAGYATLEEEPLPLEAWHALHGRLTGARLPFLVAAADGAVVGFVYATPVHPGPAHRHVVQVSLYLAPDTIRKGVGSLLLCRLLDEVRTVGVREAVGLINDVDSEPTVAFFRSHGFTQVGRLQGVGLKHGRTVDTILMQRSLRTTAPAL
ncbi:GNAT family N-acetyltransferase [Streptomyces sp. NPDC019531]|uniref:GNAT family N-acetyltransferase n=1 Tax=Streptomyces sp. NPDC019531 TaxID=3365062 RepID=UPI00384EEAC0